MPVEPFSGQHGFCDYSGMGDFKKIKDKDVKESI